MRRCRPKWQGGMHHGTFKATARREGAWREGFCFSVPIDRSWFPNPPLVGAFCVEPWAPKGKGTMMGANVQTAFCFILHATARHACCCDPLVVVSL